MIETSVRITDIDLASDDFDRYLISCAPDTSLMKLSIQKTGILQPVILASDKPFRIVAGLKRILAARDLGMQAVPAKIYNAAETGEAALLRIAVYDNLAARELSRIEKAAALFKLHVRCGEPLTALMDEFAGAFGIAPVRDKFLDYINVACLEAPIRGALARGSLEFQACVKLTLLKPDERMTLFEKIFSRVSMNLNESVAFIVEIGDLAKIRESSIAALCESPDVREILVYRKRNPRGKGAALAEHIHLLRYPELAARERSFSNAVKEGAFAEGVRVSYARHFEGDAVTVTMSFANAAAFARQCETLAANRDTGRIEELLRIVQET